MGNPRLLAAQFGVSFDKFGQVFSLQGLRGIISSRKYENSNAQKRMIFLSISRFLFKLHDDLVWVNKVYEDIMLANLLALWP